MRGYGVGGRAAFGAAERQLRPSRHHQGMAPARGHLGRSARAASVLVTRMPPGVIDVEIYNLNLRFFRFLRPSRACLRRGGW